ncbi:hypothetical protein HUJ05_004929 [Dendroctonus ponderosae]|nr:hypothetical protein HUJ05_004929 [Dendroctonus ponderosae]
MSSKDCDSSSEEPIVFHQEQPSLLLNQWLNSLEKRSSFFWVHFTEDDFHRAEASAKRANSLESNSDPLSDTDSGEHSLNLASLNSSENFEDIEDFDKLEDVFTPCRSIAHRESDLLLALTENCTLGPVCYFCR